MLTTLTLLSAGLIAFIAYDTFNNVPYNRHSVYLHFQLFVCCVFILEYFIAGAVAPRPWLKLAKTIPFLLVSIPYLNIIAWAGINVDPMVAYYLRYVPLIRSVYVMAVLVGLVSKNPAISMFWSYLSIIILMVFFASVIFYDREGAVNPRVDNYGSALWWCALEATTVGMSFDPMTRVGKIIAAVLSATGMMMFPLFTVYLTAMVRKYLKKFTPDLKK